MFINVFETLQIGGNKVATIAGILDPLYMNFRTSEGFLFEKIVILVLTGLTSKSQDLQYKNIAFKADWSSTADLAKITVSSA